MQGTLSVRYVYRDMLYYWKTCVLCLPQYSYSSNSSWHILNVLGHVSSGKMCKELVSNIPYQDRGTMHAHISVTFLSLRSLRKMKYKLALSCPTQSRSWVRTHSTQLRFAIPPPQSRSFIGVLNLRLHLEASWSIHHIDWWFGVWRV